MDVSFLTLTAKVTGFIVSCSCLRDFPTVIDWKLELGTKINPFPQKLLVAGVFYHNNRH